jgi:replicative DNA helicase
MAIAEVPSDPSRGDGRVPPYNLEAEESLLGAMLLSKDAIVAASEVGVTADNFYKPIHGHIFDAIISLYGAGEPADPVTVAEELRRAGLLGDIGGPGLLVSLQVRTPATSSASRYARIVSEHAVLRRLIAVAGEIAEMGYRVPDDVAETVDRAEAMVFDVAQHRVSDSMAPLRDLLDESLTRLEMLYEKADAITGIPTGYSGLDELLSGLQPSSLVIVGARPATGKTAFALGLAAHAALEANRPVLFFSLEMSHLEITQRILASEARVDSSRMRNGRLNESDWTKIAHAIGRLGEAPLYIDDNPRATVLEIRAKARRLKSRLGDLGVVVVDYLQLMTGRDRAENRQVEVSEISRGLKVLARELQTPVVALSQLSRGLELRADKRPMLADLRESGCLTADARVLRADTGAEVTMGELVATGERNIPIWTIDRDLAVVPGTMTCAFPTGTKPVFELRVASGRRVRASANHPFLTVDGWLRLDELRLGARIAVPRHVPAPARLCACSSTDVADLAGQVLHQGEGDRTGPERAVVPSKVFSLPDDQLGAFVRQVWSSGHRRDSILGRAGLHFASRSPRLVDDLQSLLVRLGIETSSRRLTAGPAAALTRLSVDGAESRRRLLDVLAGKPLAGAGEGPRPHYAAAGASRAAVLASGATMAQAPSPHAQRLSRLAATLCDDDLGRRAGAGVRFEPVVSIEALGEAPVFDATVPETHNFVANGIVVENSLEQDADVVIFLYRDEIYNPESADRGTAEVLVTKHRSGPTGMDRLAFLDHYTRFANMAKGI